MKVRKKVFRYDRALVGFTLALLLIGMVMVFSASSGMSENRFGSPYLFFRKQLLWDAIGVLMLLITMRIDYHAWQRWAFPLLVVSAMGLAAVLVVGPVVKGARRWIHVGPITFQPSELTKLALILWVASFLDRHRSQIPQLKKGFIPPLLVIGLTCLLILKEPDLGTPLLLSTICLMLLYMAGAKLRHILGTLFLASAPLYYELFHVGYRQKRLMAFLNPWANSQGAGYQLTEALMAFGSGGVFGKGIGASQLKQLALPDPHTDFIFPVIGEELGFIGAFGLVALFVLWGWRGWQTVRRAPDLFGQLLAAGITCWVLLQATINMAVSMGLLPTKGLPMPFISFGGSSIVITLIAVGILLNISAQAYGKAPKPNAGGIRISMKILIVAGGTGGHLYPGIAVAQALWRATVPESGHRPQIRFVVRRGDLGKDILRREGFDVLEISGQGLPRHWSAAAFKFPAVFFRSWRETFSLLDQERPDAVLGMGGYLSFPVLGAAAWRKIPTLIHEQNAVPGVANRLLARWVDSVAVSFPGSERHFPPPKVWLSGLPVRMAVQSAPASDARRALGLKTDALTFFAFGGSLGAHRLNAVFFEVWKRLRAAGRHFQVLHVTGARDFSFFEPLFKESGIPGQLLAYCHAMPQAYAAADLVLSRSGASTIAELAAVERPALLIPYPHATNDHQWFNAQVLVRRGAAEAIRETHLTPEFLVARLNRIFDAPQELREWQKRCAAVVHVIPEPSPAVTIAQHILKQAGV